MLRLRLCPVRAFTTKVGRLGHLAATDVRDGLSAVGESGRRFPPAARGADAPRLYGLDTQHDPRRTSALAWRAPMNDDNGLLDAPQPLDLLFQLRDPLAHARAEDMPHTKLATASSSSIASKPVPVIP